MVATLKFDETPRNTSAEPGYNVMLQHFGSLSSALRGSVMVPVPDRFGRESISLHDGEREWLLHELSDFSVTQLGREESHPRQSIFHCYCEQVVRRANHLEGAGVDAPRRIDDEGDERFSFHPGLPEDVRIHWCG